MNETTTERLIERREKHSGSVLCFFGLHSWVVTDACAERMSENKTHPYAGLVVCCCKCGKLSQRDVSRKHPACCNLSQRRRLAEMLSPELGSLRSYFF